MVICAGIKTLNIDLISGVKQHSVHFGADELVVNQLDITKTLLIIISQEPSLL